MVLSEFAPAWFEGAATSTDTPNTWPIAIAGHGYMIDPELYERTFVPVQRDTQDNSGEPGEQTLSAAGLWRRSQSSWALGAGQMWLDEADSTRKRFRESLGVDVFTEQHTVTLLPVTEEKRNSANSNLKLLRVGGYLYYADGAGVGFSNGTTSEQNATWVTGWTAATGLPGGNVLDISTSGSHVYVLGSDNSIYRAVPGVAAFALYYNPAIVTTRIWVAIGRLFMSNGVSIYEVTSGGTAETLVFTHPDAAMVWSAMVGTPEGVFVAGNVGQNSEIRNFVVNAAGSAFDPPVVAAEFRNEQVNALEAVGLNLLIGTSIGWRYSPIAATSQGLDYGPVIDDAGAVYDFETDTVNNETFVWFTWSAITGAASGLGRIRLAEFAAPKVPAYASDIYSAGGGTALAVASLHGRRYFAIQADGFYGGTINFVPSGTISTGRIRYGMLDLKVFVDLMWRTAPLPSGASVYATVISDSNESVTTNPQVSTSSTASSTNPLGPMFAEWVEVTFTILRGGVLTTALLVSGLPTSDASTPDAASWAVTDLNVRLRLKPDTWTPGGLGKFLMDQYPNVAGNNAWAVALSPSGQLQLSWSNDGTAVLTETSTAALGFLAGTEHYVGVALDVNDGAGGRRIQFETSEDGVAWTTLDDFTRAGTTAIFNSTGTVGVSRILPFVGDMLSAEVRNGPTPGSGTIIGNPNFAAQPAGTTSFADTAAVPKTWTVGAGAAIAVIPGSDAEAPELRAWVLRSVPSPQTTQRFLVPIILAHKIAVPHGPIQALHSDIELEFLSALVANQSIVTYQEGKLAYNVHVVNFDAKGRKWDQTASHLETLVMVELHEI